MAIDVLVAVGDVALREVLQYALELDGYRVRTVADESDARRLLAGPGVDLLLLDGTMPLPGGAVAWVEAHAPAVPLVLLFVGWDARPVLSRRDAALLPMPFGCAELKKAIAAASAAPVVN